MLQWVQNVAPFDWRICPHLSGMRLWGLHMSLGSRQSC